MGFIFGGGPSLPPPLPPLPTLEDPEIKCKREQERLARRRRRGLGATRLTQPGLGDVETLVDRPKLTSTLGGGGVG